MSYTDNNITDYTNRALFAETKSITYAMFRGFANDILMNRPAEIDSPARKGVLDHVHTRVVGPFSQKFQLSLNNQYFFGPIKFGFESDENYNQTIESIIEQVCSIVLPVLSFIDPLLVVRNGARLAAGYLLSSILSFCSAMYLFSKETLNGNRDYSKAVDNLKETASNFLIALCMPVVGTIAGILDCVRLVTSCVATLVNLVQRSCMDSPAAPALR
jgi:hypothetical protein